MVERIRWEIYRKYLIGFLIETHHFNESESHLLVQALDELIWFGERGTISVNGTSVTNGLEVRCDYGL